MSWKMNFWGYNDKTDHNIWVVTKSLVSWYHSDYTVAEFSARVQFILWRVTPILCTHRDSVCNNNVVNMGLKENEILWMFLVAWLWTPQSQSTSPWIRHGDKNQKFMQGLLIEHIQEKNHGFISSKCFMLVGGVGNDHRLNLWFKKSCKHRTGVGRKRTSRPKRYHS